MVNQQAGAVDTIDVVIAEDSRIQAEMLRRRLVKEGFTARVAKNGVVALEEIRQRRPTIVVSDIEMPEMDGYALCDAIKSDPELRNIPVILLSSLSDPTDIIQGLHVGADNYVTKPYEPEYLLSRMNSLLHTPLEQEAEEGEPLEVTLDGKQFVVKSGRQQALNLLVSTFENAVQKNRELIQTNENLTVAQDQVQQRNRELEVLNEKLQSANEKMKRDLDAGAVVQQSLLPSSLPDTQSVNFAWSFRPCDELAGDFLNIFPLTDDHIGLYVVDVSGHGVAASLLSVTISRVLTPAPFVSSLLVESIPGSDEKRITPPSEVMSQLNARFQMDVSAAQFFTIAYAVYNIKTREFRYASGGHPPIVLTSLGQKPRMLEAEGFPIGVTDEADFDEHTMSLEPGDRICLYSDGVPEAMNAKIEEFGDQRLLKSLADSQSLSLEDSVSALMADTEAWCGESGPKDDISILAMEIV